MNLKENIPVHIKRRIHLIDKVIDNLLPNMYPCDYNSSDHFVEGVLDEIRWFLLDVEELQGIERVDIENYIFDYKYDELTEYFNERCIVLKNDNLQEKIRRILREEKDQTKLIKGIIDSSDIFDYKHFCGFDIITPEERSDQYNFLNKNKIPYLIKVYFVGGPNSEVWPRTQAIRNKELDLMEELHEYIKSFVPFNIEMMGSHVNSCDGYDKLMKRKYTTDDLQESIRKVLRGETKPPLYIRRRYACIDEYITKLENGEETMPVRIRQLDWNHYQIILTAFIRGNCGDGNGYYDLEIHSKIMDVFGDRLHKWYKENINL